MADNTGPYITICELLMRLFPSDVVTNRVLLTLSNKTGNTFEWSGTNYEPEIGDIVCQGDYYSEITAVLTAPNRITLADATDIIDGSAYAYEATKTVSQFLSYRNEAMMLFDKYTGQWFNSREFDVNSPFRLEGNNTPMLQLPVPILTMTGLRVNDLEDYVDPSYFKVFDSRTLPDDRTNPRLKLLRGYEPSVFQTVDQSVFHRNKFNYMEGTFGYLESDGTTPEPVQGAIARLVMRLISTDANTYDASTGGSGEQRVKREKVDLHEIEYEYADVGASKSAALGVISGDQEVDRIILLYKSPLKMGGTMPDFMEAQGYSQDVRVRRWYDYAT